MRLGRYTHGQEGNRLERAERFGFLKQLNYEIKSKHDPYVQLSCYIGKWNIDCSGLCVGSEGGNMLV